MLENLWFCCFPSSTVNTSEQLKLKTGYSVLESLCKYHQIQENLCICYCFFFFLSFLCLFFLSFFFLSPLSTWLLKTNLWLTVLGFFWADGWPLLGGIHVIAIFLFKSCDIIILKNNSPQLVRLIKILIQGSKKELEIHSSKKHPNYCCNIYIVVF